VVRATWSESSGFIEKTSLVPGWADRNAIRPLTLKKKIFTTEAQRHGDSVLEMQARRLSAS
jgi:hypothetical protein